VFFKYLRGLCAVLYVAALAAGASAQENSPTFPVFSPDNPQRVGFVSKLPAERRAALAGFLDAADTYGFFPPDVEARGDLPFGMVLYLLPSWEEAAELPPQVLPPAAAQQLAQVPRNYFRYAIPLSRGEGETKVLVFYIIQQTSDALLACLAQDVVVMLAEGFGSGKTAECVRR
jgi:hypothetical protein